jgi:hypothetical protein
MRKRAVFHIPVMRGLVPRIHGFRAAAKAWMAGTSPAMTTSILRTAAFALVLAAGSAFWPGSGRTQEHYPLRSVKIVIPAAPGSTTDTLARIVAEHLGQTWGKPSIVENIPGGATDTRS